MTTLAEAFEIPRPDEITALGYVVVLEDQPDPAKVRQIVRDYVLTPAVRAQLREVLEKLRTALRRGDAMGRFIHGSFGSGKSNFMFFLALLIEGSELAWAKEHPDILALASEFRAYLREAKILPVRLNMLTLDRPGAGFDRLVYESYNAAVRARGRSECSFLNVDGVLDEVRAEAATYGAQAWTHLAKANVVPSQVEFETLAKGTEEDREALALAYLAFKKRDPANAGVVPAWSKGLEKLAVHAKGQDYGAVVFFVDEMLLWLTEKENHQFQEAVNQLSVIVDYAGGRRAISLSAFVARQRRLADFFPDRANDEQIQALFDRIRERFETTPLEDVELRFICKERVLHRRMPDLVQPVLDRLAVDQKKVLQAVIQQADVEYLKDVYPFHPALIEALIDVSALLQRARTALRLLTELLASSRDLDLGKFIPVGRAFELLIPQAGVEGARAGEDDLKALHRLYWRSIRPALDAMQNKGEDGFDSQRRSQLDQLLKTALLAEVSPRLKQGGITVDRLVRLNDADIQGETDKTRISQAFADLVKLTRLVPSIQMLSSGDVYGATVQVNLRGGSLAEVLERARPRVDNTNTRFRTFYGLLGEALGGEAKAALDPSAGAKQWTLKVTWRGTKRTGTALIANVREQTGATFKPAAGEEFRILIDYPWDIPPYTVEDDRNKAKSVRKNDGTFFTVCWLPRHFTQGELDLLRDLAAAELVATASQQQDDLLQSLARAERDQIINQAQTHVATLRTEVAKILPKVYRDGAVLEPLVGDVPTDISKTSLRDNLESLATRLLDRRFPLHPQFESEPKPELLQRLSDFCVAAAEAGAYRPYGDDASMIRALAGPAALDLVLMGEERGKFRDDAKLYREVMGLAQGDTVQWDPIDKRLDEAYGLPIEVRNFFLALVARIHSFRIVLQPSGEELKPEIDRRVRQGVVLKRAKLLDVAQWSMVGDLLQNLLRLPKPTAGRTVAEQDRLARDARTAGDQRRQALQGLNGKLAQLGVSDGLRVDEIREAIKRLIPLAETGIDPSDALVKLLSNWPADASDPVRTAVQKVNDASLTAIDETAFRFLARLSGNAAAQAHVDALRALLSSSFQSQQLSQTELEKWTVEAKRIMDSLVEPPLPPPPPPPPPSGAVTVLADVPLDLADSSAVTRVLEEVRVRLRNVDHKDVTINVVVKPRR